MKIWIIKAIIQKIISFLPFSHRINYLFQKYVTRGVKLSDEYLIDRLTHFKNHYNSFKQFSENDRLSNVLEIGTGWYPVIPVCFYLSGVDNIVSVDLSNLVKQKNLRLTVTKIAEYIKTNKLEKYVVNIDKNRLSSFLLLVKNVKSLSYNELLLKLNISLIVGDARKLNFNENYFDFITSNNTFEHIYLNVLVGILQELNRVLKQNLLMSHFIDMSDHFAHLDKTITIFNFLKYSEKQWKRIDNSVQPQNRLRISNYRKLYSLLQFKIIKEENRIGSKTDLNSIKLNSLFKKIPENDILITHSYLVSIK